jgi:hypothetical protein
MGKKEEGEKTERGGYEQWNVRLEERRLAAVIVVVAVVFFLFRLNRFGFEWVGKCRRKVKNDFNEGIQNSNKKRGSSRWKT